MLFGLWCLNLVISALNAWGCGSTWDASRAKGGVAHFMNWMGAVMSASGFTWCYLVVFGLLGSVLPLSWFTAIEAGQEGEMLLDAAALTAFIELGYLVIIFPILGSGLAITIQSWRRLAMARQRRFGDYAVTGWNTAAQVHNLATAFRHVPGIFDSLGEFFSGSFSSSSGSKDKGRGLIVIVLVTLAVAAGCLTTFAIIQARRRAVIWAEAEVIA